MFIRSYRSPKWTWNSNSLVTFGLTASGNIIKQTRTLLKRVSPKFRERAHLNMAGCLSHTNCWINFVLGGKHFSAFLLSTTNEVWAHPPGTNQASSQCIDAVWRIYLCKAYPVASLELELGLQTNKECKYQMQFDFQYCCFEKRKSSFKL